MCVVAYFYMGSSLIYSDQSRKLNTHKNCGLEAAATIMLPEIVSGSEKRKLSRKLLKKKVKYLILFL
jgi:hypothetical protein